MVNNIPMDTVHLSFTVEEFITTDKARVTVLVNCSFPEPRAQTDVRSDIQKALATALDADWRFLSLLRFTDHSGMERWEAVVEQRIEESKLSALRSGCKTVSTPGLKLSVKDVSYEPVAEEYEVLYAELRQRLYTKVNGELASLNMAFSDREFRVAGIGFQITHANKAEADTAYALMGSGRAAVAATAGAPKSPYDVARYYSGNESGGGGQGGAEDTDQPSGFSISKKITMTASVNLSSVVPGFEQFPL